MRLLCRPAHLSLLTRRLYPSLAAVSLDGAPTCVLPNGPYGLDRGSRSSGSGRPGVSSRPSRSRTSCPGTSSLRPGLSSWVERGSSGSIWMSHCRTFHGLGHRCQIGSPTLRPSFVSPLRIAEREASPHMPSADHGSVLTMALLPEIERRPVNGSMPSAGSLRRATPRPDASGLRASRANRRVLVLPTESHLRRAADRRGGQGSPGGAHRDASGWRREPGLGLIWTRDAGHATAALHPAVGVSGAPPIDAKRLPAPVP